MDTAGRRRIKAGGRRKDRRRAAPADGGRDRRRLIQLLASLALFLLVFVGRGVFPGQFQAWKQVLTSDVDFQAAFQTFSRSVSEGEKLPQALEDLCVTVFGGETRREDDLPTEPSEEIPAVRLLSESERLGLRYAESYGVLAGQKSEPPAVTAEPEPAQTAAVVTAVAQAYTDDGVKLPSNVSMEFYELGLEKTVAPVRGPVTSDFGYRTSPVSGKNEFHLAMDIGAPEGTEIGAFADGVVEYIGESDEFGLYLKIRHSNEVASFYAHCSKLLVHKGDTVTCGQTVALVGQTGNATGPHLHLTIEKDNIRLDPAYYVDPS